MLESQSIVRDTTPSIVEEPPLKNKKSCLRRGCLFSFGLLFFIFVGLIIITLFFQNPRPTKLASLPINFPASVPLYRFEDRAQINYLPGEKKDQLIERLAVNAFKKEKWLDLPKILLAPSTSRDIDTVEIVWQNLRVSTQQIEAFYKKNLSSQNFALGVVSREPDRLVIIFSKETIVGNLQIERGARTSDSSAVLRVDYQKR